jgi:hypothetical protein
MATVGSLSFTLRAKARQQVHKGIYSIGAGESQPNSAGWSQEDKTSSLKDFRLRGACSCA